MSQKKSNAAQCSIEPIEVYPLFDMEQFMLITRIRRLDEESANVIDEYWQRWRELLRVRRIATGNEQYVLVWLEAGVETEIEKLWEQAPSRAFSVNNLAQAMLMAVIRDLVPEVAQAGCAPVPKPNQRLRQALEQAGVPWNQSGTLERQYAMLTPYPFRGGCEICHLRQECPNAGKTGTPAP